MKFVKQFIIAMILFVLQYTLFVKLKIWGVIPNFILAYIVVVATAKDMSESIFTALLLALLNDLLINRFFGFDLLFFLFAVVLINYLCVKFIRGNFMVATMFIFGTQFLYSVFFYCINNITAKDSCFFPYIFRQGLFSSFYISIFSLIILFFLDQRLYHHRDYNV